jgi:hypothetical protein
MAGFTVSKSLMHLDAFHILASTLGVIMPCTPAVQAEANRARENLQGARKPTPSQFCRCRVKDRIQARSWRTAPNFNLELRAC